MQRGEDFPHRRVFRPARSATRMIRLFVRDMREDKQADIPITVPADIVPDLRGALFGVWGFAAEEVANAALQFGSRAGKDVYLEALEAFDAGRNLIETLGWSEGRLEEDVEIDLGSHPALMLRALQDQQITLADRITEMPATTNKEARDAVAARAARFDEFVSRVRLRLRQFSKHPAGYPLTDTSILDLLVPPSGPPRLRRSRGDD
jgi:hypothetical protein